MDCGEATDHFNEVSHEFSGNLGAYIDNDPHTSIGDVIGSGADTLSGYVIVDMACDGNDSGGHDSGGGNDGHDGSDTGSSHGGDFGVQ